MVNHIKDVSESMKPRDVLKDVFIPIYVPIWVALIGALFVLDGAKRYILAALVFFTIISFSSILYYCVVRKWLTKNKFLKWFLRLLYWMIFVTLGVLLFVKLSYIPMGSADTIYNVPVKMLHYSKESDFEFWYIKTPHVNISSDESIYKSKAEIDYYYNSSSTTNISKYNGYDSIVSIPQTGEGYNVVSIMANAFDCSINGNCWNIKHVIVPEGIKSIGEHAFYKCYNMQSIVLPRSIVSIAESAFDDCDRLTFIVYKNSYAYDFCLSHGFMYEVIQETKEIE